MPHVKGGTPEQWKVIMEGMARHDDARHRARRSRNPTDYRMAGKTGTAQAIQRGAERSATWNRRSTNVCATTPGSWPLHRPKHPQIAVAVLVENGGFGASAAAPIARKIMDAYLLPRLPKTLRCARRTAAGRRSR